MSASTLEKVKQRAIQTPKGPLPLMEINGRLLVPVSKVEEYLMIPVATVRDWIVDGRLKRYTRNGLLKKGSGRGPVYIDLNEYLKMEGI